MGFWGVKGARGEVEGRGNKGIRENIHIWLNGLWKWRVDCIHPQRWPVEQN